MQDRNLSCQVSLQCDWITLLGALFYPQIYNFFIDIGYTKDIVNQECRMQGVKKNLKDRIDPEMNDGQGVSNFMSMMGDLKWRNALFVNRKKVKGTARH